MEYLGDTLTFIAAVILATGIGYEIGRRKVIEDGVIHLKNDGQSKKPSMSVTLYQDQEKLYHDNSIVVKWADDEETRRIRFEKSWMADDV